MQLEREESYGARNRYVRMTRCQGNPDAEHVVAPTVFGKTLPTLLSHAVLTVRALLTLTRWLGRNSCFIRLFSGWNVMQLHVAKLCEQPETD